MCNQQLFSSVNGFCKYAVHIYPLIQIGPANISLPVQMGPENLKWMSISHRYGSVDSHLGLRLSPAAPHCLSSHSVTFPHTLRFQPSPISITANNHPSSLSISHHLKSSPASPYHLWPPPTASPCFGLSPLPSATSYSPITSSCPLLLPITFQPSPIASHCLPLPPAISNWFQPSPIFLVASIYL